jgi:hypothetical protein
VLRDANAGLQADLGKLTQRIDARLPAPVTPIGTGVIR